MSVRTHVLCDVPLFWLEFQQFDLEANASPKDMSDQDTPPPQSHPFPLHSHNLISLPPTKTITSQLRVSAPDWSKVIKYSTNVCHYLLMFLYV